MYVRDVIEHSIRVAAFTAQDMIKFVPATTRWAIVPEFVGVKRGHTNKY